MDKQLSIFEDEKKNKIQEQVDKLQNELDYDTRDFPITYLVDLYKDDEESVFAPDYQREELLWNINYKSRFIESLVLDYPIPLIFLGDTNDGHMEIIDGLQRISTLAEFLNDDFELKNLKKVTTLNGCSFEDLPDAEKRRLKAKALRIIILKKTTPNEVRKELFDRLNTSSLRASSSEVRGGREADNPIMKLIRELSQDEDFKKATNLSISRTKRQGDIELVSRFFAYSNNLENYKGQVLSFIDEYISSEENEWSDVKATKYRTEFINVMKFVNKHFERGFQKDDRDQTPNVRFEALAVGINLALRENPNLVLNGSIVRELLGSEDFKEWTTTDAANNRKKVYARINGVKNYLLTGNFDV